MSKNKRRVVITGMGVISSLGFNLPEFWQNLLNKKSGISRITKFDPKDHTCQIAGEIKSFDPSLWIEKRDVRRLDLFTQYAMAGAINAVQDSGFNLNSEDLARFSVILGSGIGGMTEVERQKDIVYTEGVRRVSPYFIPKVMVSAPSAEISLKFGFQGANCVTSAACASSSYAIGWAARMIQYGDADVVVTGGSEALITPVSLAGFCSARAVSTRNDEPEKASRPFDKERNGFVMGEGAGILILEELTRARKRNAKIYAEILGVGWGADAHHITDPDPAGQGAVYVMERALQDGEINKNQISYINAHGTSTLKNDLIETQAIKRVFQQDAYKIPVSSTKSMIGHLIGAAGAIECIVSALSISNNAIHSTANYEVPDPECDLDYVPGAAREQEVNYVLSNSFAFGGTNVALLLGKVTL